MHDFIRLSLVTGLLAATAMAAEPPAELPPAADRQVDFRADIQPLLKRHCIECHGPVRQESNYRVDVKKTAIAGADFGVPAVVPGNAADSPLLRYVAGLDDYTAMPPDGPRPTDAEIGLLRAWVEQGAAWPDDASAAPIHRLSTDHWSFQPPAQVSPPELDDPWIRNPIDAFVLRRLRKAELAPSPPANRPTLIRRLFLIMHGLPPAPEQVQQFVDDPRDDAYERLVAQVLADPRYGERWARHWLDVVRFAETNGFEMNQPRPGAYHYRDWVIASLNDDKPYDQFLIEQLAGDAVGADVATGFLVAGSYDQVKSPDPVLTMQQRQDELADMINTTGTAMLGLTMGCARCHNHKFDPILQKDYYAFQAVFAGVQHGSRPIRRPVSKKQQRLAEELRGRIAQLDRRIDALQPLAVVADDTPVRRPPVSFAANVDRFAPIAARWVRMTIEATTGAEPCIDELEIFTIDDGGGTRNVAAAAAGARATSSGNFPASAKHKLEHLNDGRYGNDRSWISNEAGRGWVQIELPEQVTIDRVRWARDRQRKFQDRLATQYKIEVAVEPDRWTTVATSADRLPMGARVADAAAGLPAPEAQQFRDLTAQRSELSAQLPQLDSDISAYAGTFTQPTTIHRLHRGDPMAPREPVLPDALTVLTSLQMSDETPEQQRRLALARWIASSENPLTGRVLVNRLWHYQFGTGLVDTPSDFGVNGSPPSHPELLDWLAGELVRGEWSIKHVQRLILTSATFRQSATPNEQGLARDASARLLWRFPSRRLEAEAIRDGILAVSGVLDLRRGGPGFSAFEPNENYVRNYVPKKQFGPAEWRRMVYMTKVRMEHDAVFGAFDCPDGGQVCPKRGQSTTAIQSLNLLNSEFMIQQASLLAERLERDAGDDVDAQVRRAFALAVGRPPQPIELQACAALVGEHGLPAFCRAVLNTNEFLYVP